MEPYPFSSPQKSNPFFLLLQEQKDFFSSGTTLSKAFRLRAIKKLKQALKARETQLLEALKEDLGKSFFEGYETELGMIYAEISVAEKHLGRWMNSKRTPVPLTHFPAQGKIQPEPYGTALILSPWNYPLQLCLIPLVSALAAGCCVILKPAPEAATCQKELMSLIQDTFPQKLVAVVTGGIPESQHLLELDFDKIFFTGSPRVGKLVMQAAAQHLTPITLELGGKSPCIITKEADLPLAARRIAWGKWLNCGQTCVAPDYLLVEESVQKPLIDFLKQEIQRQYGAEPLKNPDYPHLINSLHFHRQMNLMKGNDILFGGQFCSQKNRLAPTLLFPKNLQAPVMQEEIFGPLLPVIPYRTLQQLISFLQQRPRPLALYLFTQNKKERDILFSRLSFGGGCWNDTVLHLASPFLPFGGVGNSGMGNYHGKAGFEAFSHSKSLLLRGSNIDLPVRYPPYSPEKGKLLRFFLK